MSGTERPARNELMDALRGLAVCLMVLHHFLYDLCEFLGAPWWLFTNPVFDVLHYFFAGLFIFLSGISSDFSRSNLKRGAKAMALALGITLVTYFMDMTIVFGVLHLLGVCMMLYPVYKKLPTQALATVGVVLVVTGYLISGTVVEAKFLFPFGFVYEGFTSSDFFPILPHLGWYMLGTVLGRTVYADKKTRLPGTFRESVIARFFCWCGRQSLFIYLLHQPIVYGLLELIASLKR